MISVWSLLLLFAQNQEQIAKANPVLQALRYLARHQQPNGAWGRAPAACNCRCPEDVAPVAVLIDEATKSSIQGLIGLLRNVDPEVRLKAAKDLEFIGPPALGPLGLARNDADSEVRIRSAEIAKRIEASIADGDVEATGIALLAFLGAYFTDLSRDEYDGKSFGTVVRGGVEWLLRRQTKHGAFTKDDPIANSIAAFAVTELFGLTARRKEQAERAVSFVEGETPRTPRGRLWQGMVLASAQCGEIGGDKTPKLVDLSEKLSKEQGPLSRFGSPALAAWAKLKIEEDKAGTLYDFKPLDLSPEDLHLATLSLYAVDKNGDRWHRWFSALKPKVTALQEGEKAGCEEGSWDGQKFRDRLETTAYRAQTLEHYRCFYCRSVFRATDRNR